MNLKLDLSHYLEDVYKSALVYVDLEEFKTTRDVVNYIFSLYNIKEDKSYCLSVDGWYIHPNQPSSIFKSITQPIILHPLNKIKRDESSTKKDTEADEKYSLKKKTKKRSSNDETLNSSQSSITTYQEFDALSVPIKSILIPGKTKKTKTKKKIDDCSPGEVFSSDASSPCLPSQNLNIEELKSSHFSSLNERTQIENNSDFSQFSTEPLNVNSPPDSLNKSNENFELDYDALCEPIKRKRKRKHNKKKKREAQNFEERPCDTVLKERPLEAMGAVKSKNHTIFNELDDELPCVFKKKRREEDSCKFYVKNKNNIRIDSISADNEPCNADLHVERVPFSSMEFSKLKELENLKHPVHFKRNNIPLDLSSEHMTTDISDEVLLPCRRDPPSGLVATDILTPEGEETFYQLIMLSKSPYSQVFYRNNIPTSTRNLPIENGIKKNTVNQEAKYFETFTSPKPVATEILTNGIPFEFSDTDKSEQINTETLTNITSLDLNGTTQSEQRKNEMPMGKNSSGNENNTICEKSTEDITTEDLPPTFVGYNAKSKKVKKFSSLGNFLKKLRQSTGPSQDQKQYSQSYSMNKSENLPEDTEVTTLENNMSDPIDVEKEELILHLEKQSKLATYPIIHSLPKPCDIIAIKTMNIDENYCPKYSDFYTVKVVSIDGLKITLEQCDDGISSSSNGKEKIFQLDWRDIFEARLVYP